MLLRFEVANHRSILGSSGFSMIAVDADRAATRGFDLLNERVLTVAGIYGPNASGKSNVIEALAWLSMAVGRSLRGWGPGVPREPFRFAAGPASPSDFDVEMISDGVRYAYHVELDDHQVLHEALYSYPERRRRLLFERDGLDIEFRRGLGTLAGARQLLTPTTLALSAALRINRPEIEPFGRDLTGIGLLLGVARMGAWQQFARRDIPWSDLWTQFVYSTERLFARRASSSGPGRDSALALLQFADLGIDDVQVVERDGEDEIRLVHRAGEEGLPFELADESDGTRAWFHLIGPTLAALQHGQILLFDDVDASLHPKLSARLIELFQDPVTNPHGAQLIFTAHDTSLLNHLNRDEVWLTEKSGDGATTLTALADFGGDKVRRSLNLEKAYLQGRFGAVPELDQFTLRRALDHRG
jgi:hypothetical protein